MYQHNPILSVLLTEGAIFDPNSSLNYLVHKGSNEGPNLPHLHIYNNEKFKSKKYFETCIYLHKVGYFIHKDYQTMMNSKQKQEVIQFLKYTKDNTGVNYWKHFCREWNLHFPNERVRRTTIPNYMNLPTIGS